ncbi:MAG: drug/metabolite transporter (DMT)-like permease [Gammaproteobacteria bacterium]|jgi:drug/metabolite transporter (DMT)-like permease
MTALLFLTTVLIWGTTFYAITLQLGEVPPLQSVFYRFAIAAMVMWILALIRKTKTRYRGSDHVLFAVLGLFMFSLNYVVVYFATGHLVSGLVSVIFSLIIPFNILFYWLIFHEKPSLALMAGSLFGIVGITALFFEDFYGITISESVILGIGLALLSTIMASAGNIIAQLLKLRNINVTACNTWGMSYGTLFLLMAVVFAGEPWQFSQKIDYIFSLLYLSLAGTVIAFWTYLTLLHRIGAPRAAYITVIFPLVALLVSTLYEDMHWTGYKFLGVALIVAGNVFIIQRKQSVED